MFHVGHAGAARCAARIVRLERNVLPLDVTMLPQACLELAPERLGIGSGEYANSGQLWLLRARRERPPRRGAEQRMNSRRFN